MLGVVGYYEVPGLPDLDACHRLFEFCRGMGVETIIADRAPEDLAAIGKVCGECRVNVTFRQAPADLPQRSPAFGVCAALNDAAKAPNDRLLTVELPSPFDRMAELLAEIDGRGLRPTMFIVRSSPAGDAAGQAEAARTVDFFNAATCALTATRG